MYLARLKTRRQGVHYVIRESYAEGDTYRSRDLFDLGGDPSRYIVYPGGNGFYIDTMVEDAIAKKGVIVSQEALEPIFLPFLPFHIRRVINGFDRADRSAKDRACFIQDCTYHRFDQYRLHYLKLGKVNPGSLQTVPERFYAPLQKKSRDEIEYDFIAAERILSRKELARYTFEIFDLHRFFNAAWARSHPETLDQHHMDRCFVRALCALNQDETFLLDGDNAKGLHPHLIRYAVMYFDNCFLPRDPFQAFLRDFMNRHRVHRPPDSVRVSLEQSAQLFGVTVDAIRKMDGQTLTRTYRKLAMQHHPDQGGDPEAFVKLSDAYSRLMRRKNRQR